MELWRDFVDFVALIVSWWVFVDFVALIVSWWVFVNLEIRIDLIKHFLQSVK